jgi:hypothetical protein
MTDEQRLKLISNLVESDAGFESDCITIDVIQGRKVSDREKILADLVGKIYKIVHPRFSNCKHEDWEKESEDNLLKI